MVATAHGATRDATEDLESHLSSLSLTPNDDLYTRVHAMPKPNKEKIARQAVNTGMEFVKTALKACGARCKFVRKGSLFDEKLEHVSDVDLLLQAAGDDTRPAKVLQSILDARPEMRPFEIKFRDSGGGEHESKTSTIPEAAFAENIETVVATMPYAFGDHTLPLDLTITTMADHNESISHRLEKIADNVQEGKLDKVLQRLRPLVRRLRSKGPPTYALRADLTDAMNTHTGFIRYASKQLGLSASINERTNAVRLANIDASEVQDALRIAKYENNRLAKNVIERFAPEILRFAHGPIHEVLGATLAKVCRPPSPPDSQQEDDEFVFDPRDIGWYGNPDDWDIGAGMS